jgi:hypothetical protein
VRLPDLGVAIAGQSMLKVHQMTDVRWNQPFSQTRGFEYRTSCVMWETSIKGGTKQVAFFFRCKLNSTLNPRTKKSRSATGVAKKTKTKPFQELLS